MTGYVRSRLGLAVAFARAAWIYWIGVYPCLRGELRHWRARAETIPDPVLRWTALEAQRAKLGNIEGAVAFATLAPPSNRAVALRAMACYEAILDYLDCLCEMPSGDPVSNGNQLNQALVTAVEPEVAHTDYYTYHLSNGDNGYLRSLVDACRFALMLLPSYSVVIEATRRASIRIATYQSLNHGDTHGSHQPFDEWARAETLTYEESHAAKDLRWWEIGAAAGSSLGVFALIAAAADPTICSRDTAGIECAYFPWIGAVNSLLDSLIDRQEDNAPGQHRLLDYYTSSDEAFARLELIVTQAVHHAQRLALGDIHTMIVAAMTSFYLSAPEADLPDVSLAGKHIRRTLGSLDIPTRLVMNVRRVLGRTPTLY
jgi:tetraprenyl-beta-curcumene synthase